MFAISFDFVQNLQYDEYTDTHDVCVCCME